MVSVAEGVPEVVLGRHGLTVGDPVARGAAVGVMWKKGELDNEPVAQPENGGFIGEFCLRGDGVDVGKRDGAAMLGGGMGDPNVGVPGVVSLVCVNVVRIEIFGKAAVWMSMCDVKKRLQVEGGWVGGGRDDGLSNLGVWRL